MINRIQLPAEADSVREIKFCGGDILVVKHSVDLPDFGRKYLDDWARGLVNAIGKELPVIVLCPDSNDLEAMPRAKAVLLLRDLANAIGCEVIDPSEPIEPIIFPKLSPEETAKMIEAIKGMPNHGHIELTRRVMPGCQGECCKPE